MRKIFTFVCAALFAFSANAAQIAQEVEFVKAPVAQKIQKAQLSATPELKVINQEAKAPAVKLAARNLATAEPIVVIIKGNPQIVSKSGKTTIEATGNDDIIYGWVISTESLEAGKTYTYADMGEHNVYRYDNSFTVYEEATDGTFSIDAENNITASMVTESGTYLVYTKAPQPAAKEITLVADTLNFFTKMLSAGYYQMQGYTVDSTYAFSFYFISKSLSGNFTEEDFYTYSTWVDQKDGKKTVVSYQNLSAANVTVSLVKDTLYYTGTMTLATNDGQEAIFTLNLSCPYKQEWGEWDDFAPFGLNTGKYTYATLGTYTQVGVQVQVRKDNTGLKQYTLKNWGKGYYDGVGQDLVLNMNPDYTFTFVSNPVNLGAEVYLQDVATAYNTPAYASYNSYDPETGVFSFYTAVVLASSGSVYTAAEESLVMDKPITERDTVDIVSTTFSYNDLIATNGVVIYYVTDVEGYYLFRVTSNTQTVDGTFKWSDGTINDPNSYFSVSGTDKNYFQDGEFTMVTTDAGTSLTGWMIGVDEKYYRLNWSKKTGVLDYDADAPFDATFAYEDMEASIKEGVIGIYATNAENYTIGLELYADPAATEIPEGVYTISDSQEAGTALKSAGVLGGYLTECYAGTRTASGGINVPCWFMVEGTVTLSYDEYDKLNVEIDAKNSYGQPVTATVVYSPATSFEEVNAAQTINKVLRNGQVLIQKNNKVYTVLGQEVK